MAPAVFCTSRISAAYLSKNLKYASLLLRSDWTYHRPENDARPSESHASYRDAWLSEGLASFSGLWYVQSLRKSNDAYFKFFDRYAAEIRDVQNTAGAIWVGYRNATPDSPSGYQVMIYEKGAWVFHMLRTLML